MTLCSTCRSIPFRSLADTAFDDYDIRRVLVGDAVTWFNQDGSSLEVRKPFPCPWIKLKTIFEAREGAETCRLCIFLCDAAMAMQHEEVGIDSAEFEDPMGSMSKHIWIKLPRKPDSPDTKLKMFYGDSMKPGSTQVGPDILVRTTSGT